jgi:voltage-gated potassium channel
MSVQHDTIIKRLRLNFLLFLIVLGIGSIGFVILEPQYDLFQALYMTVITISTIGYTEIVEATNNVPVRVFTMILAFSGIGVLTYFVSNLASLIIEGNLSESFKRRKMEKKIDKLENHYIVCGLGNVGQNIINELIKTKRPFIFADNDENKVNTLLDLNPDQIGLGGDPTDDNFLLRLGVKKARGLLVTTGDDNTNLVVCVTAKNLNQNIKIIAECNEIKHQEKLKIAGADRVISPTFIGGLRMASEMIRPAATSFLDKMLRGTGEELRVEEVAIASKFAGQPLAALPTDDFRISLIMSIREGENWVFNPPKNHILKKDTTLIVMTTPEERAEMIEKFGEYA